MQVLCAALYLYLVAEGGVLRQWKGSREGGVGGPRGNALIDIDTSLAFTSGLFISTWLLEFVLVCRCFSRLYIFNGGIFVVIIGFYCKLTSQPRPLAPQSNNFAPVPLPCSLLLLLLSLPWLFIRILLPHFQCRLCGLLGRCASSTLLSAQPRPLGGPLHYPFLGVKLTLLLQLPLLAFPSSVSVRTAFIIMCICSILICCCSAHSARSF